MKTKIQFLKKYNIFYSDGGTDDILANDLDDATRQVKELVLRCDWGEDGSVVEVLLRDEEDEDFTLMIEVAPNHALKINEAMGQVEHCGESPENHEWTSEGEGGLNENPGFWMNGGTSTKSSSHCRKCGLRRIEHATGTQHNPGEYDTVDYKLLSDDVIEWHRENGSMNRSKQ